MIKVNLTPKVSLNYIQNSNFDFNYVLLDENYKAVHTPFMCKDYLQDIFWSESTGKRISIWGLHWSKGIFDIETPRFNLGITYKGGNLKQWIPHLQEFLNRFEEAQKIAPSIVSETDDDSIIVIEFDKAWTLNGPLLSAYTTMIRVCGAYRGGDALEYLKFSQQKATKTVTFDPIFSLVEVLRLVDTLPKLAALLEGKTFNTEKWTDFSSRDNHFVHDYGIMMCSHFPQSNI